jgi:serine/threonine protein kinase
MTDQTSGEDLPPETIDYVVADEIVRILDEYLDSLKSDHPQSRQELLQRYPHVASQIEACLAGLDFIHGRNPNQGTPQQLGDFRIIREVGRGGMGAVYEAEQVSLGRRVALKVLRFGAAADQGAIQRFQREAETVATLHHTNIVPIFFVGSENGVNFYAMQFIEGRNLAEVLSNHSGNLPVDEIASWALQAAEALQHAHHRGVIHRDVKPSNLILDQEGRVWLTDFGLARRIDDASLSMTGLLIGTPRYMSPEQAAASKNRVDHRTDLFSLGTTFYELLSGRPAFQGGSSHDVIREILTNDPPSIRSLNPSVPRDLETIILKCMAKEPDERYRSAAELTADLRAQIEGRPIHARRSNYVELASRWFKKNKQQVSNVASAVTITLLLTLGMMLAVIAQNHWSRSAIRLEALNPPLVAEFIGSQGISVATETLPMQRPIDLPADDYWVQVSASGDLSQSVPVEP